MIVGQLRERNTLTFPEAKIPATTPTVSTKPVLSSNSPVLFSIDTKKWTNSDGEVFCTVDIRGVVSSGIPYKNIHLIKCNSDESYVELKAGTYIISFIKLPTLADDMAFKAVEPITVTVDGIKPKLITVEFEVESKQGQTTQIPEKTTESEVPSTSYSPDTSTRKGTQYRKED